MWRTRLIRAAVLTSIVLAAAPTIGHGQIGALRRKAEEEAKKKLEAAGKKPDSTKAKTDSAKAKADTSQPATSASKPAAAQPPAQPAANPFMFAKDMAILTFYIKPDKTADFEKVITRLHQALANSDKPERKQQAAGWKVFNGQD